MLTKTRGYYAKALGYAGAATINDCDVSGEGTGMLTRAFHVELLTKPRVCEASLSELFSSPPHTHFLSFSVTFSAGGVFLDAFLSSPADLDSADRCHRRAIL